ncbi:hypothetical protein LEP1GSC125_3149 [Leptospira mayottensis 200901122]|uniref:Uncharacterized protein n=1 Tax=Leptospira mayottensis 200901122 TaxID=1193010 RepID=A0AA87MMS8_9LEPT|nr:hypothetical protein LEP1GSC125_3149 [Leptospira mayottensis 200901122]
MAEINLLLTVLSEIPNIWQFLSEFSFLIPYIIYTFFRFRQTLNCIFYCFFQKNLL